MWEPGGGAAGGNGRGDGEGVGGGRRGRGDNVFITKLTRHIHWPTSQCCHRLAGGGMTGAAAAQGRGRNAGGDSRGGLLAAGFLSSSPLSP